MIFHVKINDFLFNLIFKLLKFQLHNSIYTRYIQFAKVMKTTYIIWALKT